MRVCICGVQVPFASGGSELLVDSLGRELRARGVETETILLPFKWYPSRQVLSHALAWRLVDITESQGRPVDLAIATKFPSYLVRHPHKVLWLFHQFRQAYDLRGTAFDELRETAEDRRVVDAVHRMDQRAFSECEAVYTISANVSARLRQHNRVSSQPLFPPPPLGDQYRCDGYEEYIFSAGRLDGMKRIDLLLRSLAATKLSVRCIVAGRGPEEEALKRLARELGIGDRVAFPGWVSEEQLLSLYASCRAVFYAPYDEDYGFTTIEAFRSRKPVLTTADAGGVLEWVSQGETGWVTTPEPEVLAGCIEEAARDEDLCRRLGNAGRDRVNDIRWEFVVDRLLAAAP